MSNLLCKLINTTITGKLIDFEEITEEDWQQCFDLALQQNVLAMIFPSMSLLPKESRPSFNLWSKWMAYTQSIVDQSQYKWQVIEKMGSWLAEDGLSTTILKGFSLSILYPNSRLREFSDIDIFSGANYNAVNACLAKHRVLLNGMDGHHAYLNVDGISVEHHYAFSNTKVKNGLVGPEKDLQRLVVNNPEPTTLPGIYFPCPAFTALFVGWHAYEHFLQEKIELRHVIDWALAFRHLSEQEADEVYKIKCNTGWGHFVNTLTAIAIHQLMLPQEWFQNSKHETSIEHTQHVWTDIMDAPRTPKSKRLNKRRMFIAKQILKNSWKFNEYADIKSHQLLWREFIGHVSV